MGDLRAWARLLRAPNVAQGAATCAVGLWAAWPGTSPALIGAAVAATTSVAAFMAAGNLLNDLDDVESDRVNHPDRPLVSGAITVQVARMALLAAAGLSLLGLLLSIWWADQADVDSRWSALTWSVAALGMLAYERGPRLKARPFIGNVVISLLVGLVLIHGAASLGQPLMLPILLLGGVAASVNLAREIVKDCEDLEGDADRRTLPAVIGLERSRAWAYVAALTGVALLFLIFGLDAVPTWTVVFEVPAMWLILQSKPLLFTGEDHAAQRRLRLALVLGLVGALPGLALM